jgi:predicted dehydrogenase
MKTPSSSQPRETRRTFLSKTATAAAAVASVNMFKTPVYGQPQAPAAGRVLSANDRIVVAYIGVGGQGTAHVKSQKANAAANNIVQAAVSDLYQKRLGATKELLGLSDADAFTDYRKLLERKDIDAVVVSTVDNWHAQVAIDAMEAGKHVYGEKPLARYLEEGFRIYDTVKRTGKIFQLGSQYCSDGCYQKAADWIREGRLGPLAWAQGSFCRNNPKNSEWTYPVEKEASLTTIDWDRWQGRARKVEWDPNRFFSWHKYYAYNSGILGNLLAHTFLPLMMATSPEFPRRVACTGTRKISTDREISDTTHLLAEMPSGLTFCVAGSTVNEQGWAQIIRGRKATIYFSSGQNRAELKPERPFVDEIDGDKYEGEGGVADLARHEKNFFNCIRTGAIPNCNIDLGIRAHTVLCLAEQAERQSLTLLFDDKTRTIKTGDGRTVPPLSYENDPGGTSS